MATVSVSDGDTWDSIASANSVPLDELLVANGYLPDSTPDAPTAGWTVFLPADAPSVAVAPDNDHTVAASEEKLLWVQLEMSADDAANSDASLRLYTADTAYDVTVPIAGNFVLSGDTVDMVFHGVDPNASYAMDYVMGDGTSSLVFPDTPFAQIDSPPPDATS